MEDQFGVRGAVADVCRVVVLVCGVEAVAPAGGSDRPFGLDRYFHSVHFALYGADVLGERFPRTEAIRGYIQACADWGSEAFAEGGADDEAADLLLRMVDNADLAALPLAAGWRDQE